MYGYQVHFEGNNFDKEDGYFKGKTTGCGYCKEAHGLWLALRGLGLDPKTVNEANYLLRKYRKGGNFYQLSMNQLKKALK